MVAAASSAVALLSLFSGAGLQGVHAWKPWRPHPLRPRRVTSTTLLTSTSTTSTSLSKNSYNCHVGLLRAWPKVKSAWCCKHHGIGCAGDLQTLTTTTEPAQSANSTTLDNTCDEQCVFEGKSETCKAHVQRVAFSEFLGDPRSCVLARDVAIKRCPICADCSLVGAGCKILAPVTTPKPPEKNCDNVCGFDGSFETCRVRIQWASSNTFKFREDSCKLGHELVQKQCVACMTCPLEKANCTDSDAPASGVTAPPTLPSPYHCDKGLSNWQMGWTQDKASWCCKHEGKGCPVGTVDHNGPVEKPKHDCLVGLGHFEDQWNDEKRAWCCDHKKLGCSAHAIFKKFDDHEGDTQLQNKPSSRITLTALALLSASGSLVLLTGLLLVRQCSRTAVSTVAPSPQTWSRELVGCKIKGFAAGIALE